MQGYIIKFTDPNGAESYWPVGYGFRSHAHAKTIDEAEIFADSNIAAQHLQNYINPPAFWNSELQHKWRMQEKFRRWECRVHPVYVSNGARVIGPAI